jgi:transcriptional regulator with XRE-family HTH domain
MAQPDKNFSGARIAAARKLHDPPLTQADLAALRGVSTGYIGLLEIDFRKPTLEMLVGIADDLRVPVDFFFVPAGDAAEVSA